MPVKIDLQKEILVFDGAMGTYFSSLCKDPREACELANLSDPALIERIHREYIEAGCKAIKTNTFAANSVSLECGEDKALEVIAAACNIAKKSTDGEDIFIFADIGPIPQSESKDQFLAYRMLIDAFLRQGMDCFLFETFSDAGPLEACARYIKEQNPDAFVMVSFAVAPDGFTQRGLSGAALYQSMCACADIDAVGFNCVSGPHHMKEYLKTIRKGRKPLSAMPNAGYPTVVNNRTVYGVSPAYFAEEVAQMAASGAGIVGGCCGTTPAMLGALVKRLHKNATPFVKTAENESDRRKITGGRDIENSFLEKLRQGKRVIAVELDSPQGTNGEKFTQGAKKLRESGVDIITIADCPTGRVRLDSSLLACKLKREYGIEAMPHMTCRDRNLNATKALLLGLYLEEIRNVLIVTGDPIPSADRDAVKSVYNFNSRMLASYISALNEELFSPPFHLCAALNVNAVNFDIQLKLAKQKIKNGVQTLFTQPVLSERALLNLKRAKNELDAYILGGILPIVSHKNALFLNSEVSGISVDESILKLYDGKDREAAQALAVSLSVKTAQEIKEHCHGLYLMTPFGRVELIQNILKQLI